MSDTIQPSENKTWSFTTTVKEGDTEKTTRVRKVENGYIICVNKSWKENDSWQYEDKEYISKENPIPKLTSKEETSDEVKALDEFFNSGFDGMINV